MPRAPDGVPDSRDAPTIVVFDDWLDGSALSEVHALALAFQESRREHEVAPRFAWCAPKQGRHVAPVARPHVEAARRYVRDLSARLGPLIGNDAEGYEWWSNEIVELGWHVDKDERRWESRGELRHPRWSTVLYTDVAIRGRGGELALLAEPGQSPPYDRNLTSQEIPQKHHSIAPRSNRLVVFRRGLPHRVDPWEGRRTSLALNVWDVTPLAFRADDLAPWTHSLDGEDGAG